MGKFAGGFHKSTSEFHAMKFAARFLSSAVLALAGLAAADAFAQQSVRIDVQASAQQNWGGPSVKATVTFEGPPCPAAYTPSPLRDGDVVLLRDGAVVASKPASSAGSANCTGTTYAADFFLTASESAYGRHSVAVRYSGGPGYAAATSAAVEIEIVPLFVGDGPSGPWKASLETIEGPYYVSQCRTAAFAMAGAAPAAPPPGVALRPGALHFDFQQCNNECGFLCPPGIPPMPAQKIHIDVPAAAADNGVWIYGAGLGVATPFWRPLQAAVTGGTATIVVNGLPGDRGIEGWIAFGPAWPTQLQDLWWAGPGENGWGLGLAQSGEQLFAAIYVYRDDGTPVWVMMPGGSWDKAHQVFTGALYGTHGSWLGAYDPSRLNVGAAIGSARITMANGEGTLDYTIGGLSGRKSIRRYVASGSGATGSRTGMWWGGAAQNGWGLFLQEQGDNTFAAWYTYDRTGTATWYAMADGRADALGIVRGTLFAATSGPWLGASYDPARFAARKVGDLALTFQGSDAALMTYSVDGTTGSMPLFRFPF